MMLFKKAPTLIFLALFLLLHGWAPVAISHQQAKASDGDTITYLQIDYLAVQPADLLDFLELKEEVWKPVQQKRYEEGVITNWSLYEALITGPTASYNFVAVTTTRVYAELFGHDPGLLCTPLRSRYQIVKSEIWRMEGAALPAQATGPKGLYMTKNFMDTRGGSGEHAEMELDFWRPIHHVRIEQDILNSWVMYTLVKPGGSSRRYNYSTIDYYDRLADIEGSVGMELARLAHPDLSDRQRSEFFRRTGASRTAYKTEMWREVMRVGE